MAPRRHADGQRLRRQLPVQLPGRARLEHRRDQGHRLRRSQRHRLRGGPDRAGRQRRADGHAHRRRARSTRARPTPTATRSTDPGSETFARDAQSCDGGTLSAATFTPADGSGSFDCTYADGLSSHNPSVTVSDGDGADSDSLAVTVNNVAPTIAISGAANVNEGSLVQPHPGRGQRPGHGHGLELRRPLGRRRQQHLQHRRRQGTHLRRRAQRLRGHGRPGRRGRHLPRRGKRPLGARQQRRADGHAQRRPERRRGLDPHLQLHGLRSGQRGLQPRCPEL